jgi:hypothetical protein
MESHNVIYSQGEQTLELCQRYSSCSHGRPHEGKEAKAQRLILDGVKNSLIPHLAEKKTTCEMWETRKNLYKVKNEN